jgi:hypothetical protein
MVTVQFLGINKPPKTLMVNPYGILPDTSYESRPITEGENTTDSTPATKEDTNDNQKPTDNLPIE